MKSFFAALFALPLLVAASPLEVRTDGKCATGPLQCCQSTYSSTSEAGQKLIKSIGMSDQLASAHSGVVGENCSPLTIVGLGSTCKSAPVCCGDAVGLIAISCIPVIL